mmetsp:Transcript_263/g.645  ORF Transcript_263/g.645 Transcript_263/m.645 type:complete len:264 (-) Transcript_263:46-837(-)
MPPVHNARARAEARVAWLAALLAAHAGSAADGWPRRARSFVHAHGRSAGACALRHDVLARPPLVLIVPLVELGEVGAELEVVHRLRPEQEQNECVGRGQDRPLAGLVLWLAAAGRQRLGGEVLEVRAALGDHLPGRRPEELLPGRIAQVLPLRDAQVAQAAIALGAVDDLEAAAEAVLLAALGEPPDHLGGRVLSRLRDLGRLAVADHADGALILGEPAEHHRAHVRAAVAASRRQLHEVAAVHLARLRDGRLEPLAPHLHRG